MKRIVIVGGGVAGLSAGIYARLNGFEAVICERGAMAGGNLVGWRRGGYHIDNCIHWLTGTNPASPLYVMWQDLGALGDVEILQPESLYCCELEGKRLTLWRDLSRLEREMLALSSEDRGEILSFCRGVRLAQSLMGVGGAQHDRGATARERVTALPLLFKYGRMDAGALAARFHHPLIRQFLLSFLTPRFGALALFCVFAHFCADNGGLPRGGSLEMARRITERYLSLGGELLLKKEVTRVLVADGRAAGVVCADGSRITGDYVLLTCDPAVCFGRLLDVPMPRRLQRMYHSHKLMRFSSQHCAFACEGRELPFRGEMILPLLPNDQAVLGARDLILREFSHEPSFAPAGKSILQAMCFCDEERARDLVALRRDRVAYAQKKRQIAARMEGAILAHLPALHGKLRCLDVWTPATYQRYVNSEIGSYMSFAFGGGALPLGAGNGVRGLDNVLLATQWLQPPGGLPIAAKCGKRAVESICRREGKPF